MAMPVLDVGGRRSYQLLTFSTRIHDGYDWETLGSSKSSQARKRPRCPQRISRIGNQEKRIFCGTLRGYPVKAGQIEAQEAGEETSKRPDRSRFRYCGDLKHPFAVIFRL
jgi:hypothetical protein